MNLHHFHPSNEFHSNIPVVGKMKCLQELKEFYVKRESVGLELRELGGELCICNLEVVISKGESSDAKLKNKRNLKKLTSVRGIEHQNMDDDVLDDREPHP